ncbi:sec-independent protein translocase protein TatB [Nitratiruptor sp. YY08-26]|uniref:Sec-independent protein translocase protein TatB n=1 Tax=unclassified Nitratiruptor TaxID=2624044 RepID=UPI001915EAB6|nr:MULTISPECIES: Sec-independent protein translocase protein TatB [unclassified Nitratiruptor]BCD61964.1 sec-independent protein translocase protein TatB [Nitratiruptor sp. YY08-13]BCD65899.1 sec-independent protein translocase protein TatB [Nitratiruptor sp. YY08-26]
MFGMGFTEILMIAVVAIIFLGPEKLPQFLIDIAKFFKSIKRAVNDAKVQLEQEVKITELKEEADEYKKKFKSVAEEMGTITAELEEDPLAEVEEIKSAMKEQPKREVVKFKKKIDEDKDKVDV